MNAPTAFGSLVSAKTGVTGKEPKGYVRNGGHARRLVRLRGSSSQTAGARVWLDAKGNTYTNAEVTIIEVLHDAGVHQ